MFWCGAERLGFQATNSAPMGWLWRFQATGDAFPHVRAEIEECTMLGLNEVDQELRRGLGLATKDVEPFLRAGGDAAEIKFMECCWCLWKANGAELVEPFVDAAFNALPEKSRSVLFQRMLTIVYVAQDSERLQRAADEAGPG
jgi:hypothetical protein